MPTLPLRKLGAVGVITDANPYDLPPNAFSACNNVIFDENRITRSPVFKQLFSPIRSALTYDAAAGTIDANTNPYDSAEGGSSLTSRFLGSYYQQNLGGVPFVCDRDGTVRAYPNGTLTFLTPSSSTFTTDAVWSHAQVGALSFLVRQDTVPYVRNILSDTTYVPLAGDWTTGGVDCAGVTRSFMDFCIMLNIRKGVGNYNPTTVKWCNPLQYGTTSTGVLWDPGNPNFVAGENVLSEMHSGIRDGLTLGNSFIIYGQLQNWLMEYRGDASVFGFRRLPFDGGIVNTNCVVEVEGRHYVFGENDLYQHDGVSKQSIADGRVRRTIFNTLDRTRVSKCFVVHDSVANLIHFCYPTLQDSAAYVKADFCNQSAIYNYKTDTWSFMDLPNVIGGSEADATLAQNAYSGETQGYNLFNTTYTSFIGPTTPRIPLMLSVADQSAGVTDSRVFAVDLPSAGLINLPALPEVLQPAYVERVGVDLDSAGLPTSLRGYKLIQSMVPQCSFEDSTGTFTFQTGSSDLPTQAANYRSNVTYNPSTDYKLDMMVAGRYLAYKVSTASISNFQFSGMDFDVKTLSRR
jgi:hypothetical protein